MTELTKKDYYNLMEAVNIAKASYDSWIIANKNDPQKVDFAQKKKDGFLDLRARLLDLYDQCED